jgi:hypothetical protein
MRIKHLLIFVLTAVLISGCSRVVTERVPFGSSIIADVNFSSDINFTINKYFMVISSASDYQIPVPPDYEFIEPGLPPADPQIDYFQYYGTWSGYCIVDGGIIYLVRGPFASSTESYERVQIGGPVGVEDKLTFEFRIDQIFDSPLPDTIHFDFVSVDPTNFLQDHLTTPGNSIIRFDGMIVTGSDEGNSEIDPSLDILDWSITIQ